MTVTKTSYRQRPLCNSQAYISFTRHSNLTDRDKVVGYGERDDGPWCDHMSVTYDGFETSCGEYLIDQEFDVDASASLVDIGYTGLLDSPDTIEHTHGSSGCIEYDGREDTPYNIWVKYSDPSVSYDLFQRRRENGKTTHAALTVPSQAYKQPPLSSRSESILVLLENPLSIPELAGKMDLSPSKVRGSMGVLRNRGLVMKVGRAPNPITGIRCALYQAVMK